MGERLGVILVDHGSRKAEANELLGAVAAVYRRVSGQGIVEVAHMELAEPTLQQAFDRCVAAGAEVVVVHPYFLLPGTHASGDIPGMTAEAAARHPGVRYHVTAPLGVHEKIAEVIGVRVAECLAEGGGIS